MAVDLQAALAQGALPRMRGREGATPNNASGKFPRRRAPIARDVVRVAHESDARTPQPVAAL